MHGIVPTARRRGGREWQGKSRLSIESRRRGVKKQNETKRKTRAVRRLPSFPFFFSFVLPKNPIGTSFLSRDPALPGLYCIFSLLVSRKRGIIKERRGLEVTPTRPKPVPAPEMKNTLLLRTGNEVNSVRPATRSSNFISEATRKI